MFNIYNFFSIIFTYILVIRKKGVRVIFLRERYIDYFKSKKNKNCQNNKTI